MIHVYSCCNQSCPLRHPSTVLQSVLLVTFFYIIGGRFGSYLSQLLLKVCRRQRRVWISNISFVSKYSLGHIQLKYGLWLITRNAPIFSEGGCYI